MKTTFLPGLLVALQTICAAQAPRMTVRQGDGTLKELRIEQAEIDVRFAGDVAETTLELNFRNSGPRAVEGEFALGLPEGATVSGYALEVNGKMRAGVAVEKERARTAYETVKRRLIDPGIVEREAGNVYRTKVYPVPAEGTKRLRISYIETLRPGDDGMSYSLPLDFPDPLSLSCELHGEGLRVEDAAGLEFSTAAPERLEARAEGFRRKGKLEVTCETRREDVMIVEEGGRPEFMLVSRVPDMAPRPAPVPALIQLVWDASTSGRDREHAKELDLLGAWFARLRNTRVRLDLLRETVETAGEFEIRDGGWETLRRVLEDVDYDGATDLSQVRAPAGRAELLVLVGDGIGTLGGHGPEIGSPMVFIHAGHRAGEGELASMARRSGGVAVDVSDARALEKLTMRSPRLVAVEGDDVLDHFVEEEAGRRFRVFGVLKNAREGTVKLRFGYGNDVTETRLVRYRPGRSPEGIVRRLRAQGVLAGLERAGSRNREEIVRHCKKHGLVSDHTSLIVLERLEDYAEHGIRPPEPELHEEYERLAAGFVDGKHQRLASEWHAKLIWHARRFPGYEALILPRLRQVEIWKTAVESQFAPGQRDAAAFGTVAGWFEKAMELVESKPGIRTAGEYAAWRDGIDALHARGPEFARTPLQTPPAGRPVAVSVHGLVRKPGVISAAAPLTLREAIGKAGGPHPAGSLGHVALYRNSGKTVYNTLSEEFEDMPLFPADMIVVEPPFRRDHCFDDPFSDPGPSPDPRSGDPVRQQADVWVASGPASMPLGAATGGNASPADGAIRVARRVVVSADLPEPAAFAKDLASGADPASAYRKHRGDMHRPPEFYIEAARILFRAGRDALGRRVLSNLAELSAGDAGARRAHAFWLAEFGRFEESERVLKDIHGDLRTKLLVELDLISVRKQHGDAEAIDAGAPDLDELVELDEPPLASVALSEWNALRHTTEDAVKVREEPFQSNLPVDLRVVLTSSDDAGDLRFEVEEPEGTKCSAYVSPSPTGGRVTGAAGVREYMVRHAVPGVYRISCASGRPTTVRAVIHTNWGRPVQTTRVVTLLLKTDRLRQVSEVEFEFASLLTGGQRAD